MEIFKTTFIWDKAVSYRGRNHLPPYYLGVGSNLDLYPDKTSNIRHTAISGRRFSVKFPIIRNIS